MKNKTMDKIEKLELEYDDWKRGLSLGSREIHIIIGVVLKVNEIIDILNSRLFEPIITVHNQSQKQPEGKCIHYFPIDSEGVCQKCGIRFEDIKPEKQEEWREKIKQMVLTDCFKDQPDIQRYIDFIEQLLSESKEKAKIEVLEKVLEKKTNYEIEREEHGYRVTLEYVLADDIKKEIKLLKEGDDLQE